MCIRDSDESSYKNILLASNYSGKAINISRTTAAHSMSYKLTSLYGISHGHAVALCIIPIWHLLSIKAKTDKKLLEILNKISQIFEENTIEGCINKLSKMIKAFKLPNIKIKEKDIKRLVESVNMSRMNNNPVVFTTEEIEQLYKKIYKSLF